MSKSKNRHRSTGKPAVVTPGEPPTSLPTELTSYIENLAARRVGGVVNLRGVSYQLLYACERMLNLLHPDSPTVIRLEGLEDVDLHNKLIIGQTEYVQLKTSVNDMNAGSFWSLGVIQNFLEVFKGAPTATFTLTHNMRIAPGQLQMLMQHDPAALAHWVTKLRAFDKTLNAEQASNFLHQLRFEYVTEAQLYEQCIQALLTNFEVHARSEEQFLKAVFYHAFDWSRQRVTVTYSHLASVIQAVKDSYSTAPINEALRHNWLERVSYKVNEQQPASAYFAGQAARPYHIANELPVRRVEWETLIDTGLTTQAAVIIKSSSGQGKSTLAWQVGYTWQQRGHQVYEIRHCARPEVANAIVEYLRAWVRVGEQPLVIIDGLNTQVSEWVEVVGKISDLPVKFLITSREEDWYRFGSAATALPIQLVDVSLTQDEAERIYRELDRRGHLSPQTTSWQPAWEVVASRQLLIEYVYLLTQGQQLRDRLAWQLRDLDRETRNAAAKMEILRLVAVADCLAIRLDTGRLIKYVADTVGFDSDRGEVLKQLEREYFLRFDTRTVEGLHPVRSRHLAELLHEILPLSDTLFGVCQLLAREQTQDFFAGLPGLLAASDRRELYAKLAPVIAERTFLEITAAFDGLLCGEALGYWQQNQSILDEVFAAGGLELFVYETIPFAKPGVLKNLADTLEHNAGLQQLLERSKQLGPLIWADSELLLFASLLHAHLNLDEKRSTCQGLGRLGGWLHRLDLPLPTLVACGEESLLTALHSKPLAETQELFAYLWLSNPTGGKEFEARHKDLLLSYLKQHTDTPTVLEEQDDLSIEYFLDFSQGDKGNELSVERLQIFANFLPNYAHYCSKAVVLPIQPAYLYTVALMNAEKRMTADTLLMPRTARINRLWADTILNLYRAKSVYEWQESLFVGRQAAVELARRLVRFLEVRLEQQTSREEAAIAAIVTQSELLEVQRQHRPKLPSSSKDKPANNFSDAEKAVEDWLGSLSNFTRQFAGIIRPTDNNSRNLAICNLTSAVYKLPQMQAAQRTVSAQHTYFELVTLEREEVNWYQRLLDSVRFYVYCQEKRGGAKVYGVRENIRQWTKEDQQARLREVHVILQACAEALSIQLWLPTHLKQENLLKTAIVGVEGIDFQDSYQLGLLLDNLAGLCETSVDYVLILSVHNHQAGRGLRCNKDLLRHLKGFENTDDVDALADWQLPMPVVPTAKDLQTLVGIEAIPIDTPAENERVLHVIQTLWKIIEYRQRLMYAPDYEKSWLQKLEITTQATVESELRWLRLKLSDTKFNLLTGYTTRCLSKEEDIDEYELATVAEVLMK